MTIAKCQMSYLITIVSSLTLAYSAPANQISMFCNSPSWLIQLQVTLNKVCLQSQLSWVQGIV